MTQLNFCIYFVSKRKILDFFSVLFLSWIFSTGDQTQGLIHAKASALPLNYIPLQEFSMFTKVRRIINMYVLTTQPQKVRTHGHFSFLCQSIPSSYFCHGLPKDSLSLFAINNTVIIPMHVIVSWYYQICIILIL